MVSPIEPHPRPAYGGAPSEPTAQARARLEESEERFRLLVDSVKDYAIFMLDPGGYVATWNSGAERIKGWRAEEIVGQHFSTFYPPDDIAANKPAFELHVAARMGRFEDEGWRLRKDGTRFWANVVISALHAPDGTLRGFAKVTRDFTDRRAAEETARRLAAETSARRAAQEAVSIRDDFLSIAGHELKTPLTALLFHAEMLSRSSSTLSAEEIAERAAKVLRNSQRLSRLVDELLDVSRIVAGRFSLEREPVDLSEIVHEVTRRFAELALAGGSRIQVQAPGVVLGFWDRLRIEQVVENLVTNALKYGRGKPVEVRVEGDGATARLLVRDHGVGIAPSDQRRIFERFERAVSSRHYGGLGLGLWIARQMVEAHGGSIRLVSNPNDGAEFTVELPQVGPGGGPRP